MSDLHAEAASLPEASLDRAQEISWIGPPDDLAAFVPEYGPEHSAALASVHATTDQRLNALGEDRDRGAFYAASELALIEANWREDLMPADRALLRGPWEHLPA